LLVLSLAAVLASGGAVQAQGKLDAHYTVSLAGLPIGTGHWVINITEDQFTATASGATAGLLRVFASGEGKSASQGTVIAGTPVSTNFSASITADKKTEEFRITLQDGVVKDITISPATPPNTERVPLTEAHHHGVSDPMTASLIRVPGDANLMGPEACQRTLAVFDGRMRFDLKLVYKRVDEIRADKGYAGSAVVCAVYFAPLAGHNPQRAAIKYLINSRDMEMWLAPIAGTRILVPFRLSIPTPIGFGILHATEFVAVAQPPRAAAASAKTQ
jgi:hypothetical protein